MNNYIKPWAAFIVKYAHFYLILLFYTVTLLVVAIAAHANGKTCQALSGAVYK